MLTQTVARMKHYYDQSPLSCDPINSGPKFPFELSWNAAGCIQQLPSEDDTSQSQQTLRFAIPGRLLKDKVSWANTSLLKADPSPVGRCKSIQSEYFTLRRLFHRYLACTDCFCLHACPCTYAIGHLREILLF